MNFSASNSINYETEVYNTINSKTNGVTNGVLNNGYNNNSIEKNPHKEYHSIYNGSHHTALASHQQNTMINGSHGLTNSNNQSNGYINSYGYPVQNSTTSTQANNNQITQHGQLHIVNGDFKNAFNIDFKSNLNGNGVYNGSIGRYQSNQSSSSSNSK